MNLCLGTVQFGMDYGIRGQKKPSQSDAIEMLNYAVSNGISAIDTAAAYGSAEEVVGAFLSDHKSDRDRLFISTKMKPNILDDYKPNEFKTVIKENLQQSLKALNTEYVDAYLLHSARYAFRNDILDALRVVKDEGFAKKIGVSVYEPEEAFACFENEDVSIIQAPYSIFDHRMKKNGVFEKAEKNSCEVHTRSAFIQGLISMDEDQVPSFLEEARPIIKKINDICKKEGINPVNLAISYVKREKAISHLVFGVDSLRQLKEDIELFNSELPNNLLEEVEKEFDGIKAEIVMPSLWKR